MRHLVPSAGLLASLFAMISVLLFGSPAGACPAPPAWSGFFGTPANGGTGVATDVLPLYQLPTNTLTPDRVSFSLVDNAGTSVSMDVHPIAEMASNVEYGCGGSWVELVPAAPLRPNARYTIRVSVAPNPWEQTEERTDSLTFTTGPGPWQGNLVAPSTFVQSYGFTPDSVPLFYGTIGFDGGATCLALPDDVLYQLNEMGSGERWLHMGAQKLYWFASDNRLGHTAACLELHARAPNGQLSAPRAICFKDGPRYEFMNLPRSDGTMGNGGIVGCTSQGLTWEDELVAEHYTPVNDTVWEQRLGGSDFQADAAIADGVLIDAEVGDAPSASGDAGVGATMQASRARRIVEGAAACSVKGAPSGSAPSLYVLLSLTCLVLVNRRRSALAAHVAKRAAIKSSRAIASGVSASFRTDIAPGTEGKPSGPSRTRVSLAKPVSDDDLPGEVRTGGNLRRCAASDPRECDEEEPVH